MTPQEEGMTTHSSIPAWRIPWTEESGGLQSMGVQRVRRDWSDLASIQDGKTNHIFEMRLEAEKCELVN